MNPTKLIPKYTIPVTGLEDIANWRAMGNSCPGIRTDFPDDVIRRAVARQIEKRRKARLDDEMTSDPESGE